MHKIIHLLLFMSINSCASTETIVPVLKNRTLRVSKDHPGLEYQYEVCVKKNLWWCSKKEFKKEVFDFNDESIRLLLLNSGFSCRTEELP